MRGPRAWLAAALLLQGCVSAPPPPAPGPATAAPLTIPIEVMKPEGAGPFPAVVMLHDCSGLGPRSSGSPRRWARLLLEEGYVVLIPDSFSTRGHAGGVCTNPSPSRREVGPLRRVADAYEALAHARSLPYVDPGRIGVMGGSHGGATTLATLVAPRPPHSARFAAAVALYPSCNLRDGEIYRTATPLLILAGEKDDWTPAQPCRELAERASAAGHPVSIKVYPGAHHSFDNDAPQRFAEARVNASSPSGRGATTGGDPRAWADSIREVKAFFARHVAR